MSADVEMADFNDEELDAADRSWDRLASNPAHDILAGYLAAVGVKPAKIAEVLRDMPRDEVR